MQLLSRHPMHGYELSSTLKEVSEGQLEITEGALYPVLHSLEADRLIEAHWEVSKGKRKRKSIN